jgi:hypothetical protein
MQGQSEKERKREGSRKGRKLGAFAHGFVVQCLGWPRYWEVSDEQSPWICSGIREGSKGDERGTRGVNIGVARGGNDRALT